MRSGVRSVISRVGRRVSDGPAQGKLPANCHSFMFSVTWANVGEFSQGHQEVYCSDGSNWPIFCTDSLLKKEQEVSRSTKA